MYHPSINAYRDKLCYLTIYIYIFTCIYNWVLRFMSYALHVLFCRSGKFKSLDRGNGLCMKQKKKTTTDILFNEYVQMKFIIFNEMYVRRSQNLQERFK